MATNVWIELPSETSGGGSGVTSFNGRTGAVLPLAGDYTASQVTNVPSGNITALNVQNALNQLDSIKQAVITGAATTITSSNLTINRAVISDGSGKIAVSPVTSTELGYVSGVTSSIQTQLNAKGTGSVTSVALSTPGVLYTVSGSPITTSGTLTLNLVSQSANTVFAGPTSGGAVAPVFRSLVAADIPSISLTTGVSGVLPVANGGTNSSTALSNNRIMVSSAGKIVEASALTNGQLLVGSTGSAPVATTLTAGPGISIVNAAGSITVTNSSIGIGTLPTGILGDGADGDVIISVNTTLTRDMFYNNLTVNSGVTLNSGGYIIFVKGTLTISATGSIIRNGNNGGNASTSSAGGAGAALSGTTVGSSGAGAAGGAGTTGNGGNGATSAAVAGEGGTGGVGGNGGGGNGGATLGGSGGNSGAITARYFRNVQPNWKYTAVGTFMPTGVGGAGGAAGGGDGVNSGRGGGGGGSAGGAILILCDTFNNLGTVQAKGGNGGNGGGSALGNVGGGAGGGGGGGGKIMILTNSVSSLGTLDVSGGTAGLGSAGAGTGVAGTNGANGNSGYATVFVANTGVWTTTS